MQQKQTFSAQTLTLSVAAAELGRAIFGAGQTGSVRAVLRSLSRLVDGVDEVQRDGVPQLLRARYLLSAVQILHRLRVRRVRYPRHQNARRDGVRILPVKHPIRVKVPAEAARFAPFDVHVPAANDRRFHLPSLAAVFVDPLPERPHPLAVADPRAPRARCPFRRRNGDYFRFHQMIVLASLPLSVSTHSPSLLVMSWIV